MECHKGFELSSSCSSCLGNQKSFHISEKVKSCEFLVILVTFRESWQAKHQALVESPLCEIRFAEMMCLGGNGDLARESLEILFNQAFLVRGLTRPSMLLPCLVAFIGLPGYGFSLLSRNGVAGWPKRHGQRILTYVIVFLFISPDSNLSAFQRDFSHNLSMSCLCWVPWPDEFAMSPHRSLHFLTQFIFAMSVRALPSCSCLFCSAFVILGVWPKLAHGAIFYWRGNLVPRFTGVLALGSELSYLRLDVFWHFDTIFLISGTWCYTRTDSSPPKIFTQKTCSYFPEKKHCSRTWYCSEKWYLPKKLFGSIRMFLATTDYPPPKKKSAKIKFIPERKFLEYISQKKPITVAKARFQHSVFIQFFLILGGNKFFNWARELNGYSPKERYFIWGGAYFPWAGT